MKTEEIIIDEVNVASCKRLIGKDFCRYNKRPCSKDNQNCMFKKLQREIDKNKKLVWYLNAIRDEELKSLDIEWDEYETCCRNTDYSNIINLVERALREQPEI